MFLSFTRTSFALILKHVLVHIILIRFTPFFQNLQVFLFYKMLQFIIARNKQPQEFCALTLSGVLDLYTAKERKLIIWGI
jgi:hypothetical protein